MAGRIPQNFIDDLLDRVDIVDVVGSRLNLRKTGKNHSACCPFHDEKTPSFSVNPEKQFYYCFGCGAGGNAISFVMDYDRVDFVSAVEGLAAQAGLEVPRENNDRSPAQDKKKTLHAILERAALYYQDALKTHGAGKQAVAYLKQRGLSAEICERYRIGFAPPGWDNLWRHLENEAGGPELTAQMVEAGLLIQREEENKTYDRFRHRVMFPIRDTRGRCIGFGGRVLGDDTPKYLNSPETQVFHKGRELYGLYEANRSRHGRDNILVVEGYMDVVALAQHGIENAVATLGTALSADHLDKLFRHTSEIVFCFDGDRAGRQAAVRALHTSLPQMSDGRGARFLFLEEGEDPDSLVRKIGAEAFNQLIADAQPLSVFLLESCATGLNLSLPDDCAKLSQAAAPLIQQLPTGVFRELLFKQLADQTGLSTETLLNLSSPSEDLDPPPWLDASPDDDEPPPGYLDSAPDGAPPEDAHLPSNSRNRRPAVGVNAGNRSVVLKPIQLLIALLVNHPELSTQLNNIEPINELQWEDSELLEELLELLRANPNYTTNHILGYWRGMHNQEQAERLTRIASSELIIAPGEAASRRQQAQDIVDMLVRETQTKRPVAQQIEILEAQSPLDDASRKLAFQLWRDLSAQQAPAELINKLKQLLAGKKN